MLSALALALALPAGVSAAVTPAVLLSSSLAAARAQASVHYVSTASFATLRVSQVGDAGASGGSQRITYRNGTRVGRVTVLVVTNTAYIRGDALTLAGYMGLPAPSAAKYQGRWIAIPHGDSAFATVAAGATFPSLLSELKLLPPLVRVAGTTIGGVRVVGVRGRSASAAAGATTTLYVRSSGSPLPVREVAAQGTTRGIITLSRWKEPVHVTAPAGAVPIATVRRG